MIDRRRWSTHLPSGERSAHPRCAFTRSGASRCGCRPSRSARRGSCCRTSAGSPNESETRMVTDIDHDRRRFLGAAATTLAAAEVGLLGSAAGAQARRVNRAEMTTIEEGTTMPFGPLKQIDAGDLNVGYVDAGRGTAPAVILLH